MRTIRKSFVALFVCLIALPVFAQKNELSLAAGGYFPVSSVFGAGDAFALEGTFAHRLASVPFISLYGELPVVGSFRSHLPTNFFTPASYSAFFLTPGLKVKIAPSFPISPWLAVGGGWARFSKNASLASVTGSDVTNTWAFDIGGGLDVKIAPFVSARGEVRDFYTGNPFTSNPLLNLVPIVGNQNNVVATVGLVFRF